MPFARTGRCALFHCPSGCGRSSGSLCCRLWQGIFSEEVVNRQPFPGPGLAIRIIGEVTQERIDILQEADAIVYDEIKKAGLYTKIWQSFAVLPAMRSVGVMGDERTYDYTVGLRIVNSADGMTADWVRLPYEVLDAISRRIVNKVKGVNRIVYDITSKPPSTIKWE